MHRTFSEEWKEAEDAYRALGDAIIEQLGRSFVGRLLAAIVRFEQRRNVQRWRQRVRRHIPWFPFRD
jgi:uncharacterized protein (TIGR02265 family)